MKRTRGQRIFNVVNIAFLVCVALCCVLPYFSLFAKSVSANEYVIAGKIDLIPKGFNLMAYQRILTNNQFRISFFNSVLITVAGTLLRVFFTACLGYFCAHDAWPLSGVVTKLVVFTMVFNAGMIPTYLVIRWAGLVNNPLSIILPGMITGFNLFMVRNYFYTIPSSLEESAYLDGASGSRAMFSIMIPMSKPVLATVAIFSAVSLWNGYMEPMLYLTKSSARTLSVFLKDIVLSAELTSFENAEYRDVIATETYRAACVFISALPIICVYPFLQKYFIQGIALGAVKE